jgi:nucleoside-diphosphate-sugar epimerase
VLITGGAGGIGGQVVRLLSERGTKVVVLDVIPMTFEARKWRLEGMRGERLTRSSEECLLLQV